MSHELLTATEAARLLGVSRATLYHWLGMSDYGLLVIRGQNVSVRYLQTGGKGQGKILIAASEVERLKEALIVPHRAVYTRRAPIIRTQLPGIHVPLGRPNR